MSLFRLFVLTALFSVARIGSTFAQERAYFVTYDHYLEEKGNLEIAVATTSGIPKDHHATYTAPCVEFEFGLTGWWPAELYLEG